MLRGAVLELGQQHSHWCGRRFSAHETPLEFAWHTPPHLLTGASGYNVPIAVFGLLAEASRRGRHVFALLFVIPVSWVLDILRLMQFNFHSWVTIGVISAVALCMVALVKLVMMLALYQLFSEMGGTWSLTNSSAYRASPLEHTAPLNCTRRAFCAGLPLDRRHSFSTDEVVVGVVPMPHRGHTARLDGQHPGVAGPRPESRGSEAGGFGAV